MEQHPLPQAITTYKFRLVGDMTLKQFLELAFGLVLAWLIFNSSLNFFFKWTLGPLTALFGFALAFVPIEDRPLDQWLLNFFKAIFSPTQFVYKHQAKPLDLFVSSPPAPPSQEQKITQPVELEEYLQTLPPGTVSNFDVAEAKYLGHIHNLFGALGLSRPSLKSSGHPQPLTPYQSRIKGVRVRKLLTPQVCLLPRATAPQPPAEPKVAAMPKTVKPKPVAKPVVKPATPPTTPIKPAPKPTLPVKPAPTTNFVGPTFATDLVLPNPPDKPNLIAGITLDKAGKILANVIIEIRDKNNSPARALKSNKLGQFFIATPLADGIYQIQAEHPDHKFAIIKLEAKNEVIPPLKIQAI